MRTPSRHRRSQKRHEGRRTATIAAMLALGAALAVPVLLTGCTQQPHQKDTNFTKYNYQYNK